MKLYPAKPRVEYAAVLLDIGGIPALPAELSFRDQKWVLKPELHVTIMSQANLDQRYLLGMHDRIAGHLDVVREAKKAALKDVVQKCLDGLEFFVGIEPAFYAVHKNYSLTGTPNVRRSLIASCFVHEVEEFRNRFYAHSGIIEPRGSCVRAPYHVTLYTGDGSEGERRGVGIYEYCEWEKYTWKLSQAEVPSELKVF